jgi:hypothetical protein
MMRWTWIWLAAAVCAPGAVTAQDSTPRRHDAAWRRGVAHYGKWLTAGAAAAFTGLAAREHGHSRRVWTQLLDICRAADDACARAPDGRYVRTDAEALYQRALSYDRRANRRLVGAQASLLVAAVLFILDVRPGDGPENTPFAPLRVTVQPTSNGAALVGLSLSF